MFLLRRLTDMPLRRLYRYLLKKTIGVYLLGELKVDQLDVQITEGEVALTHLEVMVVGWGPPLHPPLPRQPHHLIPSFPNLLRR